VWTILGMGFGHIHVCTGAKEWGSLDDAQRTHLIIHESIHRFGDVADKGYYDSQGGCADSGDTLGLRTSQLLDNADSYACLVRLLLQSGESELEGRIKLRSGAMLVLRQSEDGDIDLNGPHAMVPYFTIGNPGANGEVDIPGGMQFRWIIADDADNRYSMMGLEGPVMEYGNRGIAYIPAGTRALLRKRGIRQAKILCRALIPHVGDRLFELPVRFRY